MFDRIFFDDYGEPGRSDQEMFLNCPNAQYKDVYNLSESHFHAFLNIVSWLQNATVSSGSFLFASSSAASKFIQTLYRHHNPHASVLHCQSYALLRRKALGWHAREGTRISGYLVHPIIAGTAIGASVASPDTPDSYSVDVRCIHLFPACRGDSTVQYCLSICLLCYSLHKSVPFKGSTAPNRSTMSAFQSCHRPTATVSSAKSSYMYDIVLSAK